MLIIDYMYMVYLEQRLQYHLHIRKYIEISTYNRYLLLFYFYLIYGGNFAYYYYYFYLFGLYFSSFLGLRYRLERRLCLLLLWTRTAWFFLDLFLKILIFLTPRWKGKFFFWNLLCWILLYYQVSHWKLWNGTSNCTRRCLYHFKVISYIRNLPPNMSKKK